MLGNKTAWEFSYRKSFKHESQKGTSASPENNAQTDTEHLFGGNHPLKRREANVGITKVQQERQPPVNPLMVRTNQYTVLSQGLSYLHEAKLGNPEATQEVLQA